MLFYNNLICFVADNGTLIHAAEWTHMKFAALTMQATDLL